MGKIDSTHIKKLLERRHTEDFFMCEVKNGPSWSSDGLLKFDAFAMKKSWTKPLITIYEVKINRQDFLRDQKYLKYFEYCHEFYFACPTDLIALNEIPERAGLIYCKDKSIRTIKKAKFVEQKIPQELFIYIIMSRINSDRYPFHNSKLEFYKDFVENKGVTQSIGIRVSDKLRQLKNENDALVKKQSKLTVIENLFRQYNVSPHWVEESLENLLKGQTVHGSQKKGMLTDIDWVIGRLNNLKKDLGGVEE